MRSETFVSDNRKRSAVLNVRAKKGARDRRRLRRVQQIPVRGANPKKFLGADVVQQKGKYSGPPELLTACFF
jgi:hypothetical protein